VSYLDLEDLINDSFLLGEDPEEWEEEEEEGEEEN